MEVWRRRQWWWVCDGYRRTGDFNQLLLSLPSIHLSFTSNHFVKSVLSRYHNSVKLKYHYMKLILPRYTKQFCTPQVRFRVRTIHFTRLTTSFKGVQATTTSEIHNGGVASSSLVKSEAESTGNKYYLIKTTLCPIFYLHLIPCLIFMHICSTEKIIVFNWTSSWWEPAFCDASYWLCERRRLRTSIMVVL